MVPGGFSVMELFVINKNSKNDGGVDGHAAADHMRACAQTAIRNRDLWLGDRHMHVCTLLYQQHHRFTQPYPCPDLKIICDLLRHAGLVFISIRPPKCWTDFYNHVIILQIASSGWYNAITVKCSCNTAKFVLTC